MCAIRWWHTKHTNACARVSLIKFSNQNQDTSPTQIGIWNREPVRCYSYKLPPSCASTWTRRWVLGAAPPVGGDIESHRRRRRAQLSLNELILRDDCSGEEGRWNWRLNGAHKQTITQADKQTKGCTTHGQIQTQSEITQTQTKEGMFCYPNQLFPPWHRWLIGSRHWVVSSTV